MTWEHPLAQLGLSLTLAFAAWGGCSSQTDAPHRPGPDASAGEDGGTDVGADVEVDVDADADVDADGPADSDSSAHEDVVDVLAEDPDSPNDQEVDAFEGDSDGDAEPDAGGGGLGEVELTLIDGAASTYYATFQSHNQKVVANANGIFLTYVHAYDETGGEAQTKATWRLARSTDGGSSFQTIFEATHATKAPAIESGPGGDIFLIHPHWTDGNAYFYRFEASKGFANPTISLVPGGSAGKYAMFFDAGRQQFSYLTWSDFFAINPWGTVSWKQKFFAAGANAYPQYPHLTMTPDGITFAAWTTTAVTDHHYYDIHFLASWNGGGSWGLPSPGQMVTLPVVCDDTGPAVPIVTPAETSMSSDRTNWLANAFYKDWKLHFLYSGTQDGGWSTRYVRYNWDWQDPKVDVRLGPTIPGDVMALSSQDGFFASDEVVGSPVYLAARTQDARIGVLRSADNGTTWHDHARSTYTPGGNKAIYAIGGARRLTTDGWMIGTFTEQDTGTGPHGVFFFRVKAQ